MIYYHSGAIFALPYLTPEEITRFNLEILVSFDDIGKENQSYRTTRDRRPVLNKILLDSGAFTAWNLGRPIELATYLKFLEKNEKMFDHYIALDVIGDAIASLKQYKEMRAAGFNPLPVWHPPFSDNCDLLKEYIDLGADYLCFGGIVSAGVTENTISRIDMAFEYLQKAGLIDKIKVHGLGVGNKRLIERYPWFSIDSTVAVISYKLGNIMFNDDHYYMTGQNFENPKYYLNPPTHRRETFLAAMAAENIDLERTKTDNYYRFGVNCFFINKWMQALKLRTDFKDVQIQSLLF